MSGKKKTSTTDTADQQTLKIGSRVRCAADGAVGRITWANGVAVKIEWPVMFSKLVDLEKIPNELAPKDWSRFAENLFALIRSSKSAPRGPMADFVLEEARKLGKAIVDMGKEMVPHSVSLFQSAFAVLAAQGSVQPPLFRFTPLITDELLQFYPQMSGFGDRFSLDQ
jgi:hypothetical protein